MDTAEKHSFIAEIKTQWRITIPPTIRELSKDLEVGDFVRVEVSLYRKKE